MAKLVITIDGPAGSGKSTIARRVAERLRAGFLDTGAMYRAVTLAAMDAEIDLTDEDKLLALLEKKDFKFVCVKNVMTVSIDGIDVSDRIRAQTVTANARYIASAKKIRQELVQMQRQFASTEEKIVTEGRDQGTVAFPDADLKFFLTAAPRERARRRHAELLAKGDRSATIEQIQKAIEIRDHSDTSRQVGPLKAAEDAIIVDTTELTIEEVVDKLLSFVKK